MNETPTVRIVAYDPRWPEFFAALRKLLAAELRTLAVSIEHVGSTAVPGLAAKPILDVDVVIASAADLLRAIQALARVGYVHQGDLGIIGREAFERPGPEVPRDGTGRVWPAHHLYVCALGSSELTRHLTFRDFLRSSPETVQAYVRLKEGLAERFPHDVEAYTRHKTEFVEGVLRRASPTPLRT